MSVERLVIEEIQKIQESFDRDNLAPIEDLLFGGSIQDGEDPFLPRSIREGHSAREVFREREQVEAVIGYPGIFGRGTLSLYKDRKIIAVGLASPDEGKPGIIETRWPVGIFDKDTMHRIEDPEIINTLQVASEVNPALVRFILGPTHGFYRELILR